MGSFPLSCQYTGTGLLESCEWQFLSETKYTQAILTFISGFVADRHTLKIPCAWFNNSAGGGTYCQAWQLSSAPRTHSWLLQVVFWSPFTCHGILVSVLQSFSKVVSLSRDQLGVESQCLCQGHSNHIGGKQSPGNLTAHTVGSGDGSEGWNFKHPGNPLCLSSLLTHLDWMSAPHTHQREPAVGRACRGSPSSPHTICYTEKSLNSHLFPINVFICTLSWGRGSAKASGSHQGPHGYHRTPGPCWGESPCQFLHCINQGMHASLNVCSMTHVCTFNVFDLFFNLKKNSPR